MISDLTRMCFRQGVSWIVVGWYHHLLWDMTNMTDKPSKLHKHAYMCKRKKWSQALDQNRASTNGIMCQYSLTCKAELCAQTVPFNCDSSGFWGFHISAGLKDDIFPFFTSIHIIHDSSCHSRLRMFQSDTWERQSSTSFPMWLLWLSETPAWVTVQNESVSWTLLSNEWFFHRYLINTHMHEPLHLTFVTASHPQLIVWNIKYSIEILYSQYFIGYLSISHVCGWQQNIVTIFWAKGARKVPG